MYMENDKWNEHLCMFWEENCVKYNETYIIYIEGVPLNEKKQYNITILIEKKEDWMRNVYWYDEENK